MLAPCLSQLSRCRLPRRTVERYEGQVAAGDDRLGRLTHHMDAPPELDLHTRYERYATDLQRGALLPRHTHRLNRYSRSAAAVERTRDQVLFRYSYSELNGGLKTSSWVSCLVTSASRVYVSIPSPARCRKACCAVRAGCLGVLEKLPCCEPRLTSLARCQALHELQGKRSAAPQVRRTGRPGADGAEKQSLQKRCSVVRTLACLILPSTRHLHTFGRAPTENGIKTVNLWHGSVLQGFKRLQKLSAVPCRTVFPAGPAGSRHVPVFAVLSADACGMMSSPQRMLAALDITLEQQISL